VVVCFNGLDISRQCLDGLAGQDYEPREVIVVDNGSQEDIRGMVAREYPQFRFIRLEENSGFAGGYNKGMEAARGQYVAVINNDAVAVPQWLRTLVEVAETDAQIGAVASVILDGNKPGVLDSCGVGIALDGMSRQVMRGQPPPEMTSPREALMPSGCACLYRMEALNTVGLFDEAFFAYCEDTDLGLRLQWAGYKTVVAPGAPVTHYYSMTAGKYSLKKVFWVERNHLWVAIKNFPFLLWVVIPFATAWRYIVQLYAILTQSGDLSGFMGRSPILEIIATILRAYLSAVKGAPSMYRKRQALFQRRKLSSVQMMKILWDYKMPMTEIILGSKPRP
jgi:GT2 family glycosyltransferase